MVYIPFLLLILSEKGVKVYIIPPKIAFFGGIALIHDKLTSKIKMPPKNAIFGGIRSIHDKMSNIFFNYSILIY